MTPGVKIHLNGTGKSPPGKGKDTRVQTSASRSTTAPDSGRDGRDGRDGRAFTDTGSLIDRLGCYFLDYMVMPEASALVASAWTVASYLADEWDRFPHLAIQSPQKRSGKTTLLELLEGVVPKPQNMTNTSAAVMYRTIEANTPTILMDEAQHLVRRGSESSEVIRELLNAGISRKNKVTRCNKETHALETFSLYCPKVLALIGELDGVLADRCLPIYLKRKTGDDAVKRYRARKVEPLAKALAEELAAWVVPNAMRVKEVYDEIEPFDIENDRTAELLTPLQSVLKVVAPDHLPMLLEYAKGLEQRDVEVEGLGVQLLAAIRHLARGNGPNGFCSTGQIVADLVASGEGPWGAMPPKGLPITNEKLAALLRPFEIRPTHSPDKTKRGFYVHQFQDAWKRYLPPCV